MSPPRRSRDDFRFDARYGRLIRKAGIGTIPFAVFYYQAELDLSPQEVWLISYVLAHRWTSELPFPAIREMARRSGITTKTLEKYKKGLEDKGYLTVVRRTRADGGNTSIGWDFSPLFERIDNLITRDIDAWVRRNPQFLEEEIALGDDDVDENVDNPPPAVRGYHGPVRRGSPGAGEGGYRGAGGGGSHGPSATGTTPCEEDTADLEHAREDSERQVKERASDTRATASSSSKHLPPGSTARSDSPDGPLPPPVSPLIDRIVRDYSTLLHDAPKSVRANCTRARRLWATAGLAEEEFVALLHEANRRTQENAHRIRKSARDGPYGIKNKMPYFFSVLTGLLDAPQGDRGED